MIYNVVKKMDNFINFQTAQAHCDIPCKIYDPLLAQIAALSCVRMMDLIKDIEAKAKLKVADYAEISRLVREKELASSEVKDAIRIIWGDYFKTPQFEQTDDVHGLTHNIMRQASKCKQSINRDDGLKLVLLVNEFADIFWMTKGVPTYVASCPYPPSLSLVYPNLKS